MKRKYRETHELIWEFLSALEAFAAECHPADKTGRMRVACVMLRERLEESHPASKEEGE